jgi:hypothetical protein
MKPRKLKPKPQEPSLRDKLSADFLAAFEADFAVNGVAVIEALRLKSPEKYAELGARLIATVEPKPDGFEQCNDMESIARKQLKSVGLENEDAMTADMIRRTIEINDRFVDELAKVAAEGIH